MQTDQKIVKIVTPIGLIYIGALPDRLCFLRLPEYPVSDRDIHVPEGLAPKVCDPPDTLSAHTIPTLRQELTEHINLCRHTPSCDGKLADVGVCQHANIDYPLLNDAVDYIIRYFMGEPVSWIGKFIPPGTDFMRNVWTATAEISFGSTVSYGELARLIGKPNTARAVGNAMGRNPLPILIPCHRVIASGGGLGGYGGGLELKRRLLEHEHLIKKPNRENGHSCPSKDEYGT